MGQKPVLSPSDAFVKTLRATLNHLYDPEYLRKSELVGLLGVAGRFDTPSTLQNLLIRAIDSLKPKPNAPDKAHALSIYELLLYRYVQQFNQAEIAVQLGISVRHLRRHQNLAIYKLASLLWEEYHLDQKSGGEPADGRPEDGQTADHSPDQLNKELDWLNESTVQATTDVPAALGAVQVMVHSLAERHHTQVHFPETSSGIAAVHPVAFQQILSNLLSLAIQWAAERELSVTTATTADQIRFEIHGLTSPSPAISAQVQQDWIHTIDELIGLSKGTLEWAFDARRFQLVASFPILVPIEVLVVDDNEEIATILQRFTRQTQYHVSGLSDPKQAIERAIKSPPDLIVLDIMMPQVDGLQLLSSFKHHPLLGKLPVIICSVLPQKDLAASLGANGFVQKPIQREAFIHALDQARSA